MQSLTTQVITLSIMAGLILPVVAIGQAPQGGGSFLEGFNEAGIIASDEGIQQTDLKTTILRVVRILLGFVAVVAMAMFIIGGFIYIASAGDEDRAARGKRLILYAIIGIIIIGVSAIVVNFVINLFIGSGN